MIDNVEEIFIHRTWQCSNAWWWVVARSR